MAYMARKKRAKRSGRRMASVRRSRSRVTKRARRPASRRKGGTRAKAGRAQRQTVRIVLEQPGQMTRTGLTANEARSGYKARF